MIYKNKPSFYIPIRIDNRGIAYCYTDYLNYTNDIIPINYLKIYGANCFGNGLKKSFEDRINRVNEN